MKDDDLVCLLPSEEIFEKALLIFLEQEKFLKELFPNVLIEQVGSSAIPGAIGKFDVDIQIRVTSIQFEQVVSGMRQYFVEKYREQIGGNELAIFKGSGEYLIDYMVTVIDSKYDDYYKVRDFLINNPETLNQYNECKKRYEGKTYAEYKKAKGEFLGGNGSVRFLNQ